MIEFKNKIVQLGFGAIGKSFFEKVSKEINFNKLIQDNATKKYGKSAIQCSAPIKIKIITTIIN